MSDPPGKKSKKSRLLRPFKRLFTSRSPSPSPSHQGAQPATPDEAIVSISASPLNSATSALQFDPQSQRAQSVTPDNTIASISAFPMNSATSASQDKPQGTEYTAILELSTTPSGPPTWEHRMKECGSTAYEGLKMAIEEIYKFSGSFPPLQTTAGVLLTISKVVDVRGSVLNV